eukprot:14119542-Alexandrium_andersonii.AAC.1
MQQRATRGRAGFGRTSASFPEQRVRPEVTPLEPQQHPGEAAPLSPVPWPLGAPPQTPWAVPSAQA